MHPTEFSIEVSVSGLGLERFRTAGDGEDRFEDEQEA
jgi:hypothetical protein